MSMFDKFDYDTSKPHNTDDIKEIIYKTKNCTPPYKVFDKYGNLKQLQWNSNESFILEFNDNFKLPVMSDSITCSGKGKIPGVDTVGKIGQRVYNTTDCVSFICSNITSNPTEYVWEKDDKLTYTEDSTYYITFTPDLSESLLLVEIENFRHEVIYNYTFNDNNIRINISSVDTPLLKGGIFYINTYKVTDNEKLLRTHIQIDVYNET